MAIVLLGLLVVIGTALRVQAYVPNESLWWDEAMLADNVARRSATELLKPLDHNQAAPPGFLLAVKASVSALGLSEYSLRLVPLVSGLVALALFVPLATRVQGLAWAVPAVLFFAFGRHMVGYGAEFKQYATDGAVSVILLLLGVWAYQRGLTWRRLVALALAGSAAVWCSHPAAFVLAGVGLMLAAGAWRDAGRFRVPGKLIVLAGAWLGSFATAYFVVFRDTARSDYMRGFWHHAFAPGLSPHFWMNLSDPKVQYRLLWPRECLLHMFEWPGGFTLVGLAALVCLVGTITLWRRDRGLWFAVAGPILLAILASGFEMYPFRERMLLFAMPGVMLLVGEGLRSLWRCSGPGGQTLPVGAIAAVLLTLGSLNHVAHRVFFPPSKGPAQIMPALEALKANWQEGDAIYAHYGSYFPLRYYADHTDWLGAHAEILESIRPPSETSMDYVEDIRKRLRGPRRVWLIAGNLSDQHFWSAMPTYLGRDLGRFEPPNAVTTILIELNAAPTEGTEHLITSD